MFQNTPWANVARLPDLIVLNKFESTQMDEFV